jgi:hypothetical protein
MKKKLLLVICLVLSIVLLGPNLLRTNVWADDDAIMDVDDNAATFTGSWPRSTNRILYYGDDYQYAVGSGGSATATATFTTAQVADITGRYQVYVRWTAGNARATNATYYIYDSTGAFKGNCIKDQRYNGGAWQFCAEVYLNSGRRGVVKIGNGNVPTSRYVCADAVRFVRISKDKDDIIGWPDATGGDWRVGGYISSIGSSTEFPTTLASTSVTCPGTGTKYVLAIAHATTRLYSGESGSSAVASIETTLNSSSTWYSGSPVSTFGVRQNTTSNNVFIAEAPVFNQRIFSCTGGSTLTVYFLARRYYSGTYTNVLYPKLTLLVFPEQY